jgi:hypothetical protein
VKLEYIRNIRVPEILLMLLAQQCDDEFGLGCTALCNAARHLAIGRPLVSGQLFGRSDLWRIFKADSLPESDWRIYE